MLTGVCQYPQEVTVTLPDAAFRITLTPVGVARLVFSASVDPGTRASSGPGAESGAPDLRELAAAQLAEYLAQRRRRFDIPLDLSACSSFQRQVLEACAGVPWGEVVTYGELARRAGCPGAARAVGAALARNPAPILVPCHRVLRGDGGLGGFIAGLEWKRRLLRLEGVTL